MPDTPRSPATRFALVATLGGFLFGYDTAVISGAVKSIDVNFIDPRGLSEVAANSLSGFAVSSALLGCIIGAAMSGWIANALGRKVGLMLSAAAFLLSAIGAAVPEIGIAPIGGMGVAALLPFNIYRMIGGVGVGLASMLSPLYIAEISPKARRGRLVSYNQMAIVLGVTIVYFVNWFIASHGNSAWLYAVGWRWMFASEGCPAILFLLLLVTVPDTPRWLIMRGRNAEAAALLDKLDGPEDARVGLKEIQRTLDVSNVSLFSFGPAVIIIGLLIAILPQVVGINAVAYYAPIMFQNMGASNNAAFLQTILVGAALVFATLITIAAVDRFGRKPLLVIGGIIMAVTMTTLGYQFDTGKLGISSIALVLIYIAAFGMSWGPVCWILLSEMFPNSIKGPALAIAVAADWIANLGVSWSFKVLDGSSYLNEHFHHGFPYFLYGIMSILATLVAICWIPETKGKSIEAIQLLWSNRRASNSTWIDLV